MLIRILFDKIQLKVLFIVKEENPSQLISYFTSYIFVVS